MSKHVLTALAVMLSMGSASAEIAGTGTAQTISSERPTLSGPAPSVAVAAQSGSSFEAYKAYLAQRARAEGVRQATIDASLPDLQIEQRVIDLDRAQMPRPSGASAPEPLTQYLQQHVTPLLIATGQARYYADWSNLLRIHERYRVDPAILMAIYGEETHFGAVTGHFDLLQALATLAFEGRRRAMFERELLSALKLLDAGVPRELLKGSYAGATGYPQFMPSLALKFRADGDGDGYADIWNNEIDALASIANVFRATGWKDGVPWGVRVRVPDALDRELIRSNTQAQRCPAVFRRLSRWMTVGEWRRLGVTVAGEALQNDELVALLEPNGPDGTGYLLTSNYRVILDYNCSNSYAISVGLLSDAIARR